MGYRGGFPVCVWWVDGLCLCRLVLLVVVGLPCGGCVFGCVGFGFGLVVLRFLFACLRRVVGGRWNVFLHGYLF